MNSSIYNALTIFHTIVAEGSIAGAARRLQMASPSVSQSLKLLENHIGLPLLNRTTRKMELTEAGHRLIDSTQNALQSLSTAVETVQDLSEKPKGLVRMTVPHIAYWLLIEPRLGEFAEQFPDIQLEISINDGTVDILKQGFDLGFRFGNQVEEQMVAKKLTEPFRLGIYASKTYQQKYGLPNTINALQQHKLIGFRFATSNRIMPLTLQDKGENLRIEMPMPIIVNSLVVAKSAILQGVGIGRFFEPLMAIQPDKQKFIPVLEKHWQSFGALYLYFMQHSQKVGRIKAVIEFFTTTE
ncbi:LysR family transcriptional regulator [Actinobacillus equuli subsp. haemolyticus]|uniref:LysR family transcriptional regulator n=1 Tax=Actinobacillus equuli TaxID=718 RepID=UPI0024467579|nr:LysR family transcriptional regulator [Actinobacillus equuli]WGE50947.1 LysR family transcriptional regulator [Actinobacillus equuli subsp. haemolyticus]